jgi:hypothetical protein
MARPLGFVIVSKVRRRLWVPVLAAALVWVAVNVVVATVRDINEQPDHKKAEAWLHDAEQELGPHPTKEEAIDWLQGSGAVWELEKKGNWRSLRMRIPEGARYEIVGRRVFGNRTFWKRPIEAELRFRFGRNPDLTLTTNPVTR